MGRDERGIFLLDLPDDVVSLPESQPAFPPQHHYQPSSSANNETSNTQAAGWRKHQRRDHSAAKRVSLLAHWISIFKFTWLRRCKSCGVRGAKCVCSRPSLALEQIFFLEERKNKYGARNFAHVSDTIMSTSSTVVTNNGSFEEYNLGDVHHSNYSNSSRRNSTSKMPRSNSAYPASSRSPARTDEFFMESSECTPARYQVKRRRGQSTPQTTTIARRDEGVSYKFYGRGGSNRTSSITSNSGYAYANNDSMVLRSSVSSMRASCASDRVSLDNHFGSMNPRVRYLDNSGAPTIQEDDEALQRLNGWLHGSPTSTTGSLAPSDRPHVYCF